MASPDNDTSPGVDGPIQVLTISRNGESKESSYELNDKALKQALEKHGAMQHKVYAIAIAGNYSS